jgi:outer membrane protein TolC
MRLNAPGADHDLFQAELALAQPRYNELVIVVELDKALGVAGNDERTASCTSFGEFHQ